MSDRAAPIESRVEANGLSHHVLTWDGGDRGLVVLCHGYLDLAWSWDRVARRLADAGHRVVAFDWRGHGETEHVGRGGYYHFADYLLDLEELLAKIAGDRAIDLVGHSMGATACAMYAGTRPDRIRRLVLIEGVGPPDQPIALAPDKVGAWLRTVARYRARTPRPLASIDEAIQRMRVQNPDLPDELAAFIAEKSTRPAPSGEGRVWTFDPLHQTTSPTQFRTEVFATFLSRITAPALIVVGEKGFRLPDERARAASIADHRFVEIPGATHMIHWIAPDALSAAILSFL